MAVSLSIKSYVEGTVTGIIILLNISVGFVQELKAAKTMDALRKLSSPTAKVIRDGNLTADHPTVQLVPGDIIEVADGDTIPADIRLIEAVSFETNEASITGESQEIRKEAGSVFDPATSAGDRKNVAYSTCKVTKGRARGVVYATGKFAQVGHVADSLQGKPSRRRQPIPKDDGSVTFSSHCRAWVGTILDGILRFLGLNEGTPLQRRLSALALCLFVFAVLCSIIVLGTNRFDATTEIAIYAVTVGLSMIPASLPVVLVITMAAGMNVMRKRHVIVRNLRSLEALGGVTSVSPIQVQRLSWTSLTSS
jgi:P-type Na+/K+ transporter